MLTLKSVLAGDHWPPKLSPSLEDWRMMRLTISWCWWCFSRADTLLTPWSLLAAAQMLTGWSPHPGQSWHRADWAPLSPGPELTPLLSQSRSRSQSEEAGGKLAAETSQPEAGGRGRGMVQGAQRGHCRNLSQMMIESKTLSIIFVTGQENYNVIDIQNYVTSCDNYYLLISITRPWFRYLNASSLGSSPELPI